jgi:ribosomal protein S18 acetylase RimI-like enzyme
MQDALATRLPASRIRSVEEACLNGWPALRGIVFDGWLLRLSEGYTRRSNSIHLLSQGSRSPDEKVASCERIYAAHGLPTVFCLTATTPPSVGAVLDERGYGPPEDETCVLYQHIGGSKPLRSSHVELTEGLPAEAWLGTLARLQGQDEKARTTHRRILGALAVPAVFASASEEGRVAAVAFGAVHDGIVCINSVATDPDFRRRGLAQRTISAILSWASDRCGATGACVPVVAANTPAVGLYRGLGFDKEAYRYHYRRRSSGAEI